METFTDNPFAGILSDGELILWVGQPEKASYLRSQRRQFKRIIFWTLAFLGSVSLLPKLGLGLNPVHWQFVVADLVLLAICAWIFCYDLRKNEIPVWHYAVTKKRVLFQYPGEDGPLVKQLPLRQIRKVQLRPYKNDLSTVTSVPTFFASNRVSFRNVGDAAKVQELVVSLLPGAE